MRHGSSQAGVTAHKHPISSRLWRLVKHCYRLRNDEVISLTVLEAIPGLATLSSIAQTTWRILASLGAALSIYPAHHALPSPSDDV